MPIIDQIIIEPTEQTLQIFKKDLCLLDLSSLENMPVFQPLPNSQ